MLFRSLNQAPEFVSLVFCVSGIVPAALMAILLNVLLPKEEAKVEA